MEKVLWAYRSFFEEKRLRPAYRLVNEIHTHCAEGGKMVGARAGARRALYP